MVVLGGLEAWSLVLIVAEAHHYRSFGYRLDVFPCTVIGVFVGSSWLAMLQRRSSLTVFVAVLATYVGGALVAICCFPLNYLRSDMLPVISWADQRMLLHLNPYGTMHVGTRLYDFPYLPGMLVAFWPAAWLRVDLRWANLFYIVGAACLIFWVTPLERRWKAACLLGLFLLCPFLQYRHDLYLQPHWFLLVVAVVLLQRRHLMWSAVVWGLSCAVYQLSWVMLPFLVLHGARRRGLGGALKVGCAAACGILVLAGPFLRSALSRIASNTVAQWSRLPHALADPVNVSYWLTYLIRPDQLKWVQATVLCGIFSYCVARRRCRTLADTLRWMCVALAVFIPLNVLVDGYFYLTLALMLLLFVCAADGVWNSLSEEQGDPVPLPAASVE